MNKLQAEKQPENLEKIDCVTAITVTKQAEKHFLELLAKEETPGLNLRIYVANPGTAIAEIGLTFCPPNEHEKNDLRIQFEGFILYVDSASKNALKEARIDFQEDDLGGQLSIKAKNLRGAMPSDASPLSDRIQYLLDAEINPNLASHGGRVRLVEILEDSIIVLQFGGGCHGCGMANVTLKNGIEKTLKERFPEIIEVRDITDHSTGKNPYFAKTCSSVKNEEVKSEEGEKV